MLEDTRTALLKGSCFCGTVTFSLFGLPLLSAYCHCTICQRLMGKSIPNVRRLRVERCTMTGCPFVHTMHFREEDFNWTKTHKRPIWETLDHYENPLKPYKRRFRCKQCGTQVASFNTRTGQYSVWGACLERGPDGEVLKWEQVRPSAHQFYGTRMLDVDDGLGKWEGYQGKSAQIA